MTSPRVRIGMVCALAALAVAIPFLFGPYRVGQFTLVLVYAVAVLGLNLLVGYNGQISLGHGAFFALGAYSAALLIEKANVPHLLAVPAAGAICFVAGYLFGIPALRLRGLYLALVTLGLAIAFPQLIKRFDGLTEGTQGLDRGTASGAELARPRRRPVPLPPGACVRRVDVPLRLEPRARTAWASHHSRARRRDPGIHGRGGPRRYQDARVRRERRLRRSGRCALRVRDRFRGSGGVHAHDLVRVPRGNRGRRPGHDLGGDIRGPLHRVRPGSTRAT